jgi:HAD superfamily hydrolase (TIGR01509 family)
MKLSAVIFDLDGTVLSNEDEWGRAFGKVLEQLGVKNVSFFPHIGGIGIKENWPYLLDKYNIMTGKSLDELAVLTHQEYEKLLPEVTLKAGYKEFIGELKESGIATALATSSTWNMVEMIFSLIDFKEDFDFITTGEEVISKKPDPQIFRITADKLGIPASECLVIEDSPAGIEAARSAGMKVIAIARDEEHKKILNYSDHIIENFRNLTPEIIAKL